MIHLYVCMDGRMFVCVCVCLCMCERNDDVLIDVCRNCRWYFAQKGYHFHWLVSSFCSSFACLCTWPMNLFFVWLWRSYNKISHMFTPLVSFGLNRLSLPKTRSFLRLFLMLFVWFLFSQMLKFGFSPSPVCNTIKNNTFAVCGGCLSLYLNEIIA